MPTVDLIATEDAHIVEAVPGGTANISVLHVDNDGGSEVWSLLKFDLSSIPAGAAIKSATLKLKVATISPNDKVEVWAIGATWSESTVTWATKPSSTGSLVATGGTGTPVGSFFERDVKTLVRSWYAGTLSNHGLYLKPEAVGSDCDFHSSEAASSADRPRLVVTYVPAPGAFTEPDPGDTVNTLADVSHGASTDADSYEYDLSRTNGASWVDFASRAGATGDLDFTAIAATTAAKLRVRAVGDGQTTNWTESGAFVIAHDAPHAPPTLLSPAGGTTTDRTATALRWQANPAVGGSGQSKADVRYRLTGAGAWTTVAPAVVGAGDTYLIPSTLAADEWEWQAQTYNAMDEASGWSGSGVFNAGNIPSAPTITSHTLDEVIATASDLLEWTGTGTSTRARVVADDGAGNPDTGDILEDTGTVTPGVTSAGFEFDNNVTVHLQVMRTVGGLDSSWASVRVDVDYDDPAAPTVNVAELETGALTVTITNPAPTGDQPALDFNEVHKRIKRVSPTGAVTYEKANGDLITADGYRVATDLAADETFTDRAVPSLSAEQIARGESVEYLARAWGVNGTYVDGEWS